MFLFGVSRGGGLDRGENRSARGKEGQDGLGEWHCGAVEMEADIGFGYVRFIRRRVWVAEKGSKDVAGEASCFVLGYLGITTRNPKPHCQ